MAKGDELKEIIERATLLEAKARVAVAQAQISSAHLQRRKDLDELEKFKGHIPLKSSKSKISAKGS